MVSKVKKSDGNYAAKDYVDDVEMNFKLIEMNGPIYLTSL